MGISEETMNRETYLIIKRLYEAALNVLTTDINPVKAMELQQSIIAMRNTCKRYGYQI